ncbi:hypothetical protein [Pseudomonas sp. ATCC 13867]|uniref:hypothetical protein n=1 Tax=Pseudomonas sp. ATCC 13867 TaxID=1294143 RepID=UPI00138B1540|nr:hypothetical protein [Pseudomonas sp. ATCC 13867]
MAEWLPQNCLFQQNRPFAAVQFDLQATERSKECAQTIASFSHERVVNFEWQPIREIC